MVFARHLRTFCVLRNECENQYDVILIIKTNAVCFSPVRPHPHPPNLRPYILIASIGQSLPPWVLLCKESPSCDPSRQFLWSHCTECWLGVFVTSPHPMCRGLRLQNLGHLLCSSTLAKPLLQTCYRNTCYLSGALSCSTEWKDAQRSHLPSPGFLLSAAHIFPAASCHRNDLESKTQWTVMTGAGGVQEAGGRQGGRLL